MHIEAIAYSAAAPGAGGAAAAAVTGDSLQMLNDRSGHCDIISWHAKNQGAGYHQLIFPSGHDTTRGYRVNVGVDELDPRIPWGLAFQPTATEILGVTVAGSATAADEELGFFNIHYPNFPGIDGQYLTFDQVRKNTDKLVSLSGTLTGTAVGWSGSALINAATFGDNLKANRNYALLGFTCNTSVAAIALRSPANGNRRIACPGDSADNDFCQQYFAQLSRAFGIPAIPIFNSNDKGNTFFEILNDENNIASLITAHMVLLK